MNAQFFSDRPLEFLSDPIDTLDRSLHPKDFELLSFLIAGLSYGRVEQIHKSSLELMRRLELLGLGPTGEGLSSTLAEWNEEHRVALKKSLKSWTHRLNTAADMIAVFDVLAQIVKADVTLAQLFQKNHRESPKEQLIEFCQAFRNYGEKQQLRKKNKKWRGTGLTWFAASPADGGTCKRLMMWLRWMVRKDSIDPGTWQDERVLHPNLARPHTSRLFLPVDTHVFRWARAQGILTQKTPNWRAVEAVTEHCRKWAPEDPVKFDFEICHQGMQSFRNNPSNSDYET